MAKYENMNQLNIKKEGGKDRFICKNKHMQGKCPVCVEWLEKNVCQTEDNGHKFHRDCLYKMQSSGKRCPLCIEDNIPPECDCFKLKHKNVPDKAAMRDMAQENVKCDTCKHVGPFAEIKRLHTEGGCDNAEGGYDNAEGGFDNAEGGFDNAEGGFDIAEGGFDNAEGGYDNAEGGFDNAEGGFDNAEGGYDNAEGGFDNAEGGFDNAEGGYDNAGAGCDNAKGGCDNAEGGFDNVGCTWQCTIC